MRENEEKETANGNQSIHCNHTMVKIKELKSHPQNPNRHPQKQIDLLAKSIKSLGWRHPVIVSKRSGFIVAGHARVEAAKKNGYDSVPVEYQDFKTDHDELAFLLADNKISELSSGCSEIELSILEQLSGSDIDLEIAGFDDQMFNELQTICDAKTNGNFVMDSVFDEGKIKEMAEKEVKKCPTCGAKLKR